MTFIPKVKTKVGGKVPGKLIDKETGRPYLGEFIQDYKGNFYKGTSITSSSEKLLLEKPKPKTTTVEGLRFIYTKPSDKDYTRGTFKRYFVRDVAINKVVEVDKKKYIEYTKLNKPYYITYELDWNITGIKKDYFINSKRVPGVESKNKELTVKAEKTIPGISSQILKDPAQFVRN